MKKNLLPVILTTLFLLILVYTRFGHLSWGLPYPFHPDERNMAVALQQLNCTSFPLNCFNPHFFAYGQFPLYLGFVLVKLYQFFSNLHSPITFEQAIISLRVISALASVITSLLLIKIFEAILSSWEISINKVVLYISSSLFVFSPALIQFAHFGTTESLLMLFFTAIVYVSILFHRKKISESQAAAFFSILLGLAIGTKVSSLIFTLVPLYVVIAHERQKRTTIVSIFFTVTKILFGALFVSFLTSPYNLIAWSDFLSSIRYESAIGLGQIKVFYTQQFQDSLPLLFQMIRIFPYALGWPVFVLSMAGFIFLPWKKEINIIHVAIFIYILFNAGLYTKWTRFMAPVFPLFLLLAALFINWIVSTLKKYEMKSSFSKRIQKISTVGLSLLLVILCILPGIAYVSIYTKEDVRMTASQWLTTHIVPGDYVVQEAGNVVDLPLVGGVQTNLLDFYQIDNELAKNELTAAVSQADYILVPSRRVFGNYTCEKNINYGYTPDHCVNLKKTYPLLNDYYHRLFSGELGFEEVASFTSYPTVQIFGKKLIFPDEQAEETWSVFDHPVIRVYKRISSDKKGI